MRNILIPIDFTEASLNGLRYAFEFAKKTGGRLHLFHAINPAPNIADNTFREDLSEMEGNARIQLEEICEKLAAKSKGYTIHCTHHVSFGFAEDAILNIVREIEIDLIVMGTKGAEGWAIFGGSLTGDVLSKTDCPVLAIPQDYNFTDISKIAFATDLLGNEKSEVNFVVEFAKAFDAHIAFLNIQKNEPDDLQDIVKTGFDLLNANEYKNMSFHIIEKDDIEEGIQDFAEKERADIIVMSTYKKGLFDRMLRKSHTRKVAGETHIPLLAMHKEKIGVKA